MTKREIDLAKFQIEKIFEHHLGTKMENLKEKDVPVMMLKSISEFLESMFLKGEDHTGVEEK